MIHKEIAGLEIMLATVIKRVDTATEDLERNEYLSAADRRRISAWKAEYLRTITEMRAELVYLMTKAMYQKD